MNVSPRKGAAPRNMGIWKKLTRARPGERFVKLREHRKRIGQGSCPAEKCVNILGGTFLVIVGSILILTPGPGLLIFGIGMALLGTEFLFIARAMDVAELKAREILAEIKGWGRETRQRGTSPSGIRAAQSHPHKNAIPFASRSR